MDCQGSVLQTTQSYLFEFVAPQANEIDSNPETLFNALRGLGDLNLLALKVKRQWGGQEVSAQTFGKFQELIARYSGALAFVQTQHQSAGGMLVASGNSRLQQEYLPRMGKGEVLLGVGFSQIRREGEPLTKAVEVPGGYQLDGVVPWITGYGLFQEFIIAATLADGRAVFGIVPFEETYQESGGVIAFSVPAKLAAMTSTNTVSATLTGYFLSQERVLFIRPAGWIHQSDRNNVVRATFLATGCGLAGLDVIAQASQKKSLPFIHKAWKSLQQELNNCRAAIREVQEYPGVEFSQKLQLRAWAIDLAMRIAQAAITVSSGAANYSHHNAQRVYREALVFAVTGQTGDVMEATLERLVSPNLNSQPREIGNKKVNSIHYSQVIHLSHVIDFNIPIWLGDPPVEIETVAQIHNDGYFLRRFSLGEHSGTHMNAPNSFYASGVGIHRYPGNSLVLEAVVINIWKQAAENPDYVLTVADILAWESENGEIPCGSLVLLYTGWQEKWFDKKAFINQDAQGKLHFPGFSRDATQLLIEQRQIAGVGIDTHGVDGGADTSFATNHLVLAKPRIVLENLTNLDLLPATGVTIVIGVLRLRGGSGSPAAVMAFLP